MKSLHELPACVVSRKIKEQEITAEEYISTIIERIRQVDHKINSFISNNFESALSKSRTIDKKIKEGLNTGLLAGIPVGIKDNISVQGLKNTCASRMLSEYIPPYNATVVSKIEAQDGIVIGKLNMDEFGMGTTSEYSAFGPVRNPWNLGYVAGGSSGGSAASVASLQIPLSLGSDTGGSIRCPSSFCSVIGIKPTYGSVSRNGLISYSNSLEQIGPIARTIYDLVTLLNVISGVDPKDNTTLPKNYEYKTDHVDHILKKKYKIGVLNDLIDDSETEVAENTRKKVKQLKDRGCEMEDTRIPLSNYALASYYVIATAEASSNLSRFDNLRYGYQGSPEGYEWNSYFSESRSKFGDEVKLRILLGSYVLSAGYFGKYYAKAQKLRSMIKREFDILFNKYDILLLPTMPVLPFRLGEKTLQPIENYNLDVYTILANLAGIPAISIPGGLSKEGFPIGVQLIANAFGEQKLIDVAVLLENIEGFETWIPKI
ncbi:MAG: Asp-tRNA(Asn)/Glu-tRNA(Gln) amidotransferase subunit GatA [Candidatus Nitrosocosmicus sp.]|nr:Asp-tRNA(Asn)/Glu-tRNA(Gln) amidotransferase subunit GatA [Candidatus Nitrosocosmicus sp.]MDN5866793.1 Asp-tRNA(Asn)/Glu-tRNA(Gln) amidotransferase subunit GatA [Candidatus Nitrosocosmicus sp.]